jgi:Zn ribbon nucleic-acid-binding protein
MAQHYTKSTVMASCHCPRCGKITMHRVDNGHIGPCLACIVKLELDRAKPKERQKEPEQEKLF